MISTLNRAHLKKQKQNTYSHTQELMQEVHTHIQMNSCKKHKVTKSVRALAFLLALTVEPVACHFQYVALPVPEHLPYSGYATASWL